MTPRATTRCGSPIDSQHLAPHLEPLQPTKKAHAEHRLSLAVDHRSLDLLDREFADADLAQQYGRCVNRAIGGLHGVIEHQIAALDAGGPSVIRVEDDKGCAGIDHEAYRSSI